VAAVGGGGGRGGGECTQQRRPPLSHGTVGVAVVGGGCKSPGGCVQVAAGCIIMVVAIHAGSPISASADGGVDRCAVSVTTAPAAAMRNWAGCPSAAMSCHSAAALRPTLVDLSAVRRLESTCRRRDWLVAQGRIAPGRSGSMADPPRRQRAQDPGERGPCTRRRAGAGAGAHAVALLVPLTPIMPCPGWCSHPAARRDACQMTAVALAGRR
jgi:hypothetical protein